MKSENLRFRIWWRLVPEAKVGGGSRPKIGAYAGNAILHGKNLWSPHYLLDLSQIWDKKKRFDEIYDGCHPASWRCLCHAGLHPWALGKPMPGRLRTILPAEGPMATSRSYDGHKGRVNSDPDRKCTGSLVYGVCWLTGAYKKALRVRSTARNRLLGWTGSRRWWGTPRPVRRCQVVENVKNITTEEIYVFTQMEPYIASKIRTDRFCPINPPKVGEKRWCQGQRPEMVPLNTKLRTGSPGGDCTNAQLPLIEPWLALVKTGRAIRSVSSLKIKTRIVD